MGKNPHLYAHGGKRSHLREFQARYGSQKGARVYGAVVGKVRRERMAAGKCSVRGCAAPARHYHGMHGCCGTRLHHDLLNAAHLAGAMTN